jgi:hypothetical protein
MSDETGDGKRRAGNNWLTSALHGKELPPAIEDEGGTGPTALGDTEAAVSLPWDADALPRAPAAELLPADALPVIAEVLSFLAETAERAANGDGEAN